MEEVRPSPPSPPRTSRRQEESSLMSGMKKGCLSFVVYLQEGFGYLKAFVVGQTKKLAARNEKEATRADLETAKMQVEATDAAEKRLDMYH